MSKIFKRDLLLVNLLIFICIIPPVFAKGKAEIYFDRALYYYGKGEIDEAIYYYKKSIELELENVSVYNNLGLAYADKKEYYLAIKLHFFLELIIFIPINGVNHIMNLKSILALMMN